MVEFMRFGVRGDKEVGSASILPFTPLVAARGMAELMVPLEAGERVDRGERCSCEGLGVFVGVDLVGVVAGVVCSGTDERSWGISC
jgi:hypothetical protein